MLQTLVCVVAAVAAQPQPIQLMDKDYVQIVFSDPDTQGNRNPVELPVSGIVDPQVGILILNFGVPCGSVNVVLDNLNDGTHITSSVLGTGSAMIPFSCSTGIWAISIMTGSGSIYNGSFVL